MDLRSVYNRLRGYYEAEELRIRMSWEQTRWQTAALLNVYAKKGKSIKPVDLVRFPWEAEQQKQKESALMAIAEKRWAKWDEDIKRRHG